MWAPGSPGRLPAMEECSEDGDADVDVYRRTRGAMASCWGRFGVAALWRRLQQLSLGRRRRRHGRSIPGAGGLNYDPLSYAQNFDDGGPDPDFTARNCYFLRPKDCHSGGEKSLRKSVALAPGLHLTVRYPLIFHIVHGRIAPHGARIAPPRCRASSSPPPTADPPPRRASSSSRLPRGSSSPAGPQRSAAATPLHSLVSLNPSSPNRSSSVGPSSPNRSSSIGPPSPAPSSAVGAPPPRLIWPPSAALMHPRRRVAARRHPRQRRARGAVARRPRW